jgi:hypothetical protein
VSACAVLAAADAAGAAVVVGKASDGTSYRLHGHGLVLHLRASIGRASVRCGDLAGVTPSRRGRTELIWADVARAAIRPHRGSSTFRVRFARDISSRVSLCFVTRRGERPASPPRKRRATMRLQSGAPAGCRHGRYEVTVLSIGSVDLLNAFRGGRALRACRPGDPRPTRLLSDFSDSKIELGPILLTGDVIALQRYREDAGSPSSIVRAVNLETGRRIGTIRPKIKASEVAVSAVGVLACIERPSLDANAPATLLARRLDGKIVTLDSSPGNGLSGLHVAGTTVSWLHDGAQRSASVAAPS